MKKKIKFDTLNFNINVDGTPVEVVAKPYINGSEEKRFRVSFNGSPIHIFALNEHEQKVQLMDSASETIPLKIERAIADTLIQKAAA